MYKIYNVLSNKDRKKLIKDIQPFLMTREELNIYYNNDITYMGKQTDQMFHLIPEVAPVMKKIIDKIKEEFFLDLEVRRSWVKWSNGRDDQIGMHHHYAFRDISFTGVYYLKTIPFFSSGTLFEDGFVRSPQNSMLIFAAPLLHSTPTNPFPFIDRYTVQFDLNYRNPE